MSFVPPKAVVLVPSFKVFSMINNKFPYFLVQMLFKLHHLVSSFFFLPVFVHTWCIPWCCDFVLISQSWMHLLWKFILLVLVLCVNLQQVLFLTSTIELSTWCLWNTISCSCCLGSLLYCLCSSLVNYISCVFWWSILMVLSDQVFTGFSPDAFLSPSFLPAEQD